MTNRSYRRAANSGFTLIELMVVVGIIGILAGVAALNVATSMKRTRMNTLKYDLRVMRDLIQQYKVDKKKYPDSLQTLVSEGYLRTIPPDTITGTNQSWIELTGEDLKTDDGDLGLSMDFGTSTGFLGSGSGMDVDAEDGGIQDVESGASGVDLDGVPYSEY